MGPTAAPSRSSVDRYETAGPGIGPKPVDCLKEKDYLVKAWVKRKRK